MFAPQNLDNFKQSIGPAHRITLNKMECGLA